MIFEISLFMYHNLCINLYKSVIFSFLITGLREYLDYMLFLPFFLSDHPIIYALSLNIIIFLQFIHKMVKIVWLIQTITQLIILPIYCMIDS